MSERNERIECAAERAGFVRVDAGVWVRASQIELVRFPNEDEHGTSIFSVIGCDDPWSSDRQIADLLTDIAVAEGREP